MRCLPEPISRVIKKLDALQRLCYHILSVSEYPSFIMDVENRMLPVVQTYIVAAENTLMQWNNKREKLRKISQRMTGENTPVRCFLNFANSRFQPLSEDIAKYKENVELAIEKTHKTTQTAHSVYASNFYFTQYVLLQLLRSQQELRPAFLDLAKLHLSRATDKRHHRLNLICACAEVENGTVNYTTHPDFAVTEFSLLNSPYSSVKFAAPFSVEQVLKADPDTATLLRFGIDACQKFSAITV